VSIAAVWRAVRAAPPAYRRDLVWLGALLRWVGRAACSRFTVRASSTTVGDGPLPLSMLILVAAVVLVWRAAISIVTSPSASRADQPASS